MKPAIQLDGNGNHAIYIDNHQIGESFVTDYQARIALGFLHSLTSLDLINIANAKKFGFYEHAADQVHQPGGIEKESSPEIPSADSRDCPQL